MDFDNSWKALLKPGETTLYFDIHGQTKFQVDQPDFSLVNAWWLAEFSRLIYRLGPQEAPSFPAGPTRQEILNRVGLEELKFIRSEKAQCAVIKSIAGADPRYRALVFRGTDEPIDWLTNLKVRLTRWAGAGHVHEGFGDARGGEKAAPNSVHLRVAFGGRQGIRRVVVRCEDLQGRE